MYQLYIKRQYIKRQSITIEGGTYLPDTIRGRHIPAFASKSDFHYQLYLFLKEWYSRSPFIDVRTSGSTGEPKEMKVEKSRMMQSAQMTCSFLGLQRGDKALLCMSLDYIAGKMMVVRALVAGLDLYPVTPSGNPLADTDVQFDFAAMIPMQVFNSLHIEKERSRLMHISNLIIGGGAIDKRLEEQLKDFPNKVYSTYGMTETLSHIALRKVNGEDSSDSYIPLKGVRLSLSEDDTLVINAPEISREKLETNDIAELHEDGSFIILGRKDNVINSGGVKIYAEEVEALLKPFIDCPFAITSFPDAKFGEIVLLVVEGSNDIYIPENKLPDYCAPRKIIRVNRIPFTETGKISRAGLKELIWTRR